MPVWYIGDACIPVNEPDHAVMFVYDLGDKPELGWVMCNWPEGDRMIKRAYHVEDIKRVPRELARR